MIEEDGETAVFVVEKAPPPKPDDATRRDGGEQEHAKNDTKAKQSRRQDCAKPLPADTLVAHRSLVKVGYSDGDHIEIRGGVDEGARVITVGRNAVRDGTAVQVIGRCAGQTASGR